MSGFDALRSNVAQLAQMAARGFSPPRFGIVSSYDPDAYAVKVKLQPSDIESGWLPILVLQAGKAWGIYAGPAIGDMALIVFQEGDVDVGICLGFVPNDEDAPPKVESGEILLIHKDADAFIKLQADGAINSKGTWTHEGTMDVSETIHAGGDITSDADVIDASGVTLAEVRISYNAHHHPDPQGGVSGGTDNPAE